MEPEIQRSLSEIPTSETGSAPEVALEPTVAAPPAPPPSGMRRVLSFMHWVFIGSTGLRAFWSVLIFILLFLLGAQGFGRAISSLHLISKGTDFTPARGFWTELNPFLAMVVAASLVALIERRRSLLEYNLIGPHRPMRFISGLVAGFAALSALIGVLAWGGFLQMGAIALSGADAFRFAAVWACCFLLVGMVEEGLFRCYLLATLTRGINFWWALGVVALICGMLFFKAKGNGVWGVYAIALLGLIPCFLLQVNKAEGAGFWQAAWVTSTLFGFIHTGNNGENWIGIFAAAFIGFVFCVSVRVTGSAWWAIGCHAAWDWGETFFYGTADSGITAKGHYLTSTPVGAAFWSGGTDGPEGSVLVIPIVLLLLTALLLIYRRGRPAAVQVNALPATQEG
jgi:uncharacterized protein